MPYNNVITRTDAQALVPEEVSDEMLTNIEGESAALSLFRHVPIAVNQIRMPVLSALPVAYFVNGDTGFKQTTKMAWENKFFNVEEIAAIVPIPENVLDDAGFDVWGSVRPALEVAIGRALDVAIFFGVNKPSSWPSSIVAAAEIANNKVTRGTNNAAAGGIAEDLNDLFSLLEAEGQDISAAIARTTLRGVARSARDSTGQRTSEVTVNDWWGIPVTYPMRGLWPVGSGNAEAIVGDFSQGLIGIRRDVTYRVLDQAVIQDPATGDIIFNLPQQDMVALRVTARYAFQVANPINYDEGDPAKRYPFGILLQP